MSHWFLRMSLSIETLWEHNVYNSICSHQNVSAPVFNIPLHACCIGCTRLPFLTYMCMSLLVYTLMAVQLCCMEMECSVDLLHVLLQWGILEDMHHLVLRQEGQAQLRQKPWQQIIQAGQSSWLRVSTTLKTGTVCSFTSTSCWSDWCSASSCMWLYTSGWNVIIELYTGLLQASYIPVVACCAFHSSEIYYIYTVQVA